MSVFICNCGEKFEEKNIPQEACGLLKPLKQQVALETFQAKELSILFACNTEERKKWSNRHFGPEYPDDWELEELIEDFLYASHRRDGCTATFVCPSCSRLSLLYDVKED